MLPHGKPCSLRLGVFSATTVALDAKLVLRTQLIIVSQWPPTCMALIIATRLKLMIYSDPVVEDKTLTFPRRCVCRNTLKII